MTQYCVAKYNEHTYCVEFFPLSSSTPPQKKKKKPTHSHTHREHMHAAHTTLSSLPLTVTCSYLRPYAPLNACPNELKRGIVKMSQQSISVACRYHVVFFCVCVCVLLLFFTRMELQIFSWHCIWKNTERERETVKRQTRRTRAICCGSSQQQNPAWRFGGDMSKGGQGFLWKPSGDGRTMMVIQTGSSTARMVVTSSNVRSGRRGRPSVGTVRQGTAQSKMVVTSSNIKYTERGGPSVGTFRQGTEQSEMVVTPTNVRS